MAKGKVLLLRCVLLYVARAINGRRTGFVLPAHPPRQTLNSKRRTTPSKPVGTTPFFTTTETLPSPSLRVRIERRDLFLHLFTCARDKCLLPSSSSVVASMMPARR